VSEQNDDFVSFDKALRDLKLQSEELKKLVSEGEIRAFRDGPSMKFRREDIEALRRKDEPEELVFADALEDDTGMVTEELSDEDTLLAEDDFEAAPAARVVSSRPSARERIAAEEPQHEPGWVTALAIVTCVVMVYGFMIAYSVAGELPPSGLTAMFAK
jgi:ribosomal protein S21